VFAAAVLIVALVLGSAVLRNGSHRQERARVDTGSPATTAPNLIPATPEAGDAAFWTVATDPPPLPTRSSFVATVARLGCNEGRTGRVLRPGVVLTASRIAITFTVEDVATDDGTFDATCPPNDHARFEVQLGEPIGYRSLVDGACLDGGAARGTPICGGGPVRRGPAPGPGALAAYQDAVADTIECLEDLQITVEGPIAQASGHQYTFSYHGGPPLDEMDPFVAHARADACQEPLFRHIENRFGRDPELQEVFLDQVACIPEARRSELPAPGLPTTRRQLDAVPTDQLDRVDLNLDRALIDAPVPVERCVEDASGARRH
jgi:hypothetical protein